MRRRSPRMLTLLLAAPLAVSAAEAFKCTAADGSVAFQDHPCARGARQQRVPLPAYALPPAPADAGVADRDATPPPAQTTVPAAPLAPREPPPSFFLCTRYDGSRYASDSGAGARHAVPYGLLGGSGRSLARSYGGRDGIGVSAPGLRGIPILPAAEAPFASSYVEVEDECHRASPQEACAYLRGELDGMRDKLGRAFSDTQAQLEQQERELRGRLRGC